MKMCKSAAVAVTCVLLTACGGGGGSPAVPAGGSPGTTSPENTRRVTVQSSNPDATLDAAARVAANRPRFGSVTQSSNTGDTAGVTGDSASASFDGSKVSVTVRRADGSSVAFNSASHGIDTDTLDPMLSGYSFRGDQMLTSTANSLTLAAAYTHWNNEDPNDYLAGGYWMQAKGRVDPLEITGIEIGAFVDGPELTGDPTLPVNGSATYTGRAAGSFGYRSESDDETIIGEFYGDASLTAEFSDSPTVSGCIGCNGGLFTSGTAISESGLTSEFEDEPAQSRIRLQAAPVTGGSFTGKVKVESTNVTNSSGTWGGRFSTKTQAGDPRLTAGTVGTEWTESDGSRGTAVGVWIGTRN